MYRLYTFQVGSWISAINMSHVHNMKRNLDDVQCKQIPSWNDFYENAEDLSCRNLTRQNVLVQVDEILAQ